MAFKGFSLLFKRARGKCFARAYLIVNRQSYMYVRDTVHWILNELERFLVKQHCHGRHEGGRLTAVEFRVQDDVSEKVIVENALVLVIGDPFGPFRKQENSTYVFINFSLLYDLSPRGMTDASARDWIERKRQAMIQRAKMYDAVLNFLPEQQEILSFDLAPLALEVFPFFVDIALPEQKKACRDEPLWDLCIVGSRTPRREKLFNYLRQHGITLSPTESDDLENTMRKSRIVLNVHAYQTLNTEYPRIVQALALGCCLVTEPCLGLEKVIPEHCYCCVSFELMPNKIMSLLKSPRLCNKLGENASRFMRDKYRKRSQSQFIARISELSSLHERLRQ
ncbi:hypothetical protein Thiosp_04504 [Thiorhodovibrio litoralis]|nr:hypothetical protein Thiosp_04504 [Thiorhodovibrio litoralis]